MIPLSHIYLTAHGEWSAGTAWAGERAQIGLRLLCRRVVEGAPPYGQLFTLPPAGESLTEVIQQAELASGTNGTLACAWHLNHDTAPNGMTPDQQIDLAEDVRVFLNTIKTYTSSSFKWTHVKMAPIKPDGAYAAPASVYTFTTPLAGSSSTAATLPPEVAIAVSLRAQIMGRRGRGRFYLPACATGANGNDGVLLSGAITTIGNATKQLLTDLENMPGADLPSDLWVIVTSAGSAQAVRPTQVRVGNHWDVQARRQDQVPEAYSVFAR
jgi:hypothetical protein